MEYCDSLSSFCGPYPSGRVDEPWWRRSVVEVAGFLVGLNADIAVMSSRNVCTKK